MTAKPIKTLELRYPMIQFLIIPNYYMVSFMSGQDELNRAVIDSPSRQDAWRWSYLARSWLPAVSREKNHPESQTMHPFRPSFFGDSGWILASFFILRVYGPRLQPSWPHAWSITHVARSTTNQRLLWFSLFYYFLLRSSYIAKINIYWLVLWGTVLFSRESRCFLRRRRGKHWN